MIVDSVDYEHAGAFMEKFQIRRVVTGMNAEGRSCVILDGNPPAKLAATQSESIAYSLWQTDGPQASNEGIADAAAEPFDISLSFGASKFVTTWFPPVPNAAKLSSDERARLARRAASPARRTAHDHPGMHATNSVDYVVIMKGELVLVLEDGETVLHAGDVLIDRGVPHAWENRGIEPAVLIAALIDAAPLSLDTGPNH